MSSRLERGTRATALATAAAVADVATARSHFQPASRRTAVDSFSPMYSCI